MNWYKKNIVAHVAMQRDRILNILKEKIPGRDSAFYLRIFNLLQNYENKLNSDKDKTKSKTINQYIKKITIPENTSNAHVKDIIEQDLRRIIEKKNKTEHQITNKRKDNEASIIRSIREAFPDESGEVIDYLVDKVMTHKEDVNQVIQKYEESRPSGDNSVLYSDPPYEIIKVNEWVDGGTENISGQEETVHSLFKDTAWCVRQRSWFFSDTYGPPYYLIRKNGQPYILTHENSDPLDIHDKKLIDEKQEEFDKLTEDSGLDEISLESKRLKYEREIEEIRNEWDLHGNVYGDATIEEADDFIYVYCSGGAYFDIPKNFFINPNDDELYNIHQSNLDEALSNAAYSHDAFGIEEVNIEDNGDSVSVRFYIRDEDSMNSDPQGYADFMSNIEYGWSDNYDQIRSSIIQTLQKHGFVKENIISQAQDGWADSNFQNFAWDIDGSTLEIRSRPIGIASMLNPYLYQRKETEGIYKKAGDAVVENLKNHIKKFFMNINPVFKGMEDYMPAPFSIGDIIQPSLSLDDKGGKLIC